MPASDRAALTFYYDADCGMCTATVRWLRRFDWRRQDRVEGGASHRQPASGYHAGGPGPVGLPRLRFGRELRGFLRLPQDVHSDALALPAGRADVGSRGASHRRSSSIDWSPITGTGFPGAGCPAGVLTAWTNGATERQERNPTQGRETWGRQSEPAITGTKR